jgi:hypothetical protein
MGKNKVKLRGMSERTADPVRTGQGEIGSVGSQPDRGTPSFRFGYLGGVDPLTGTPSPAPTLGKEQAVTRSPVPNTSNRVLVFSEVCATGYKRLDWALEVDGSDTEKGRILLTLSKVRRCDNRSSTEGTPSASAAHLGQYIADLN